MSLLPTKKQWKSWALPSKYAVLGVILTVVGILVGILVAVLLRGPSSSRIERIVRRVAQENREHLTKRYPAGYAVFGMVPTGFVVPKGIIPDGFKVKWDTGKVHSTTGDAVNVTIPDIIFDDGLMTGNSTVIRKRVGEKSGRLIAIGGIGVVIEVIGIQGDLVVAAMGLEPKTRGE